MSYEVELDRYIHDLLREAGIEEESTSIDLASKSQTGGIGFPDHFAVVKNFVLVMENKSDITKLLQKQRRMQKEGNAYGVIRKSLLFVILILYQDLC